MSVIMRRLSAPTKPSLLAVSALVLALSAASAAENTAADSSGKASSSKANIITDTSRIVSTDTSRIVSIGGSITEILYALGLQQNIVAVDTTSLYPPAALQDKPNVGYMRQLSAEGVLSLSPTLVLALQGSGPKETIDILQQSNVPFVAVPDKFSGQGIIEKIRVVAQSVGTPARGECLARHVGDDLATLDVMRAQVRERIKVAFVLSLSANRPMIAGRATAADGIIALAGATNAFADFDGYKLVNDEAIIAAKPDAVLVMQRGEHGLSAETVFAQPALAMTPAAERKALVSMDGLYLLGFGPRTAAAARDLAAHLYPNIDVGTAASKADAGVARCAQ
jgi:iron complex transport system substrate-binding protein